METAKSTAFCTSSVQYCAQARQISIPHDCADGRTPGTALHNNQRTPGTRGNQDSAARPAAKALNTVAAASTRPSRFMQAAAGAGPALGHRPSAGGSALSGSHAQPSEQRLSSAHEAPPSTGCSFVMPSFATYLFAMCLFAMNRFALPCTVLAHLVCFA